MTCNVSIRTPGRRADCDHEKGHTGPHECREAGLRWVAVRGRLLGACRWCSDPNAIVHDEGTRLHFCQGGLAEQWWGPGTRAATVRKK